MRCAALILLSAAVLAGCAPATPPATTEAVPPPAVPRFADYPAVYEIAPEALAVDLSSHPEARRYAAELRRGAEKGADFAGYVAVASWGCGTACERFAFIDGLHGGVVMGPTASHGADWRKDSRLFIVNPPEAMPVTGDGTPAAGEAETEYWLWTGGGLQRIAVPG